ncbi:MAG: nucleotide exchange factor GrpE [Bacteroidales bacterium]|nr:nucleotide exchange factor GrpE [Bacteroidales bacterium]
MSKKHKETVKEETVIKDEAPQNNETVEEKVVDETAEEIAGLRKEVEQLKASVAKEKDDYLRLMADFENFRRHSAEAKLELVNSASSGIIKDLLPVLDDCQRALAMLEEAKDEAAREGTELIYNKLMGVLKGKGLEPIEAKGEKFDTDFHEAVAQIPVPEEDKKGLVFDVVQTGYTLSGKVIRYAKVVVGI